MVTDLISRRAAIKAIDDLPNCYNGYSDAYDKSCIIGVLEEVPTADPVKHGKWIPHEETAEFSPGVMLTAKGYICSECGERFGNAWTWCGNCGAKMERSEDEAD